MDKSKKFALIGAAGYIAPRHMQAIKDTGSELSAAYDPNDSVGVMDSYFPNAAFFTEFERFDRHMDKLRRAAGKVDFVSICSPNYLHDAHIRFGLRNDADVICEKPLVLNPWNIDALQEIERESGRKIYTILQLRLHESIRALKARVDAASVDKIFDMDLTYLTARGQWYYSSWKGDMAKSGGIATNIGIHFFDMLGWIFGRVISNTIHVHTHDRAAGFLEFERARIRWFLSIAYDTLPVEVRAQGKRTFRSLVVNGEEIEFSAGFTELHTASYQDILNGGGFGLEVSRQAVEIVHDIRTKKPVGLIGDYHPFASLPQQKHPFL